MFPRRAELEERFIKTIDKFRRKGATSSDNAMSVDELGLPSQFEWLMKGPLGRLGVFIEVDGKYYLSEERAREVEKHFETVVGDMILKYPPSSPPFMHWIRHTASVPKGFLRYHVLKLLKERTISGSEIMQEIKEETNGRWKPSPGSIYPLLAWLQDNGYTIEVPTKESGMKRYKLTEKGEQFLQEQTQLKGKLRKKLDYFAPPFFGGFRSDLHSEKLRKLHEPTGRFVSALVGLRRTLEENLTEQAVKEVREFLNTTTERIEEISKRLQKED
ncbi:MAG: PadR family transcriptional regulator [Candidatus Bathyarchaeota archaeon]|nr:MAG: PadR family transcriptional regulator [Candidatus Bathyarchaeota archaeon]